MIPDVAAAAALPGMSFGRAEIADMTAAGAVVVSQAQDHQPAGHAGMVKWQRQDASQKTRWLDVLMHVGHAIE